MILDDLVGHHENFTVTVFAIAVLAFIGVCLLILRMVDAAKRRRSSRLLPVVGIRKQAAGSADDVARPVAPRSGPVSTTNVPAAPASSEIQLRDANHSLFMVLMDCCNMILEVDDGSPIAKSEAFGYAANLRKFGRSSMSNKEIADAGYELAAGLQPINDPVMVAIRRVLTQLALAARWGSQLPPV